MAEKKTKKNEGCGGNQVFASCTFESLGLRHPLCKELKGFLLSLFNIYIHTHTHVCVLQLEILSKILVHRVFDVKIQLFFVSNFLKAVSIDFESVAEALVVKRGHFLLFHMVLVSQTSWVLKFQPTSRLRQFRLFSLGNTCNYLF